MSNIKGRLDRAEERAGTKDKVVLFLWLEKGESKEAAFQRMYPGYPYPTAPDLEVICAMWS
jgi:hypothetical protein